MVSISPTFYNQLFCKKVFFEVFLLLHVYFGFVIFCQKSDMFYLNGPLPFLRIHLI